MAGFANTRYTDTVESIMTTIQDKIKTNPNYKFSDKNPVPVTYFNINKYKSTLDEAAKISFSEINISSGIRWNKINKFIVYGSETMQLTFSVEDFGLQTQEIEGECVILPGTITPYSGDFFLIDHLNEKVIFEVIDVNVDTLENGANMYKLQYRSSSVEYDDNNIDLITEDTFDFVIDNVGTTYNPILRSEVSVLMKIIQDYIMKLQDFYKASFYNERVQAFTFKYINDANFYDPMLVEFIIRNKLMDAIDGENYLYICHQINVRSTFALDYMKSIFLALEKRDNKLSKYRYIARGKLINNPMTTFYNRMEDYYELSYNDEFPAYLQPIQTFREELIQAAESGKVFSLNKDLLIYNIMIKYLNSKQIEQQDLDDLFTVIDEMPNIVLFYMIPCIIYCLNRTILDMCSKNK